MLSWFNSNLVINETQRLLQWHRQPVCWEVSLHNVSITELHPSSHLRGHCVGAGVGTQEMSRVGSEGGGYAAVGEMSAKGRQRERVVGNRE